MLDFMDIAVERDKKGVAVISPDYIVQSSPELLIRGGDFYAIWNEDTKLWSTSEDTAFKLMDRKLDEFAKAFREENPETPVRVLHLRKAKSGMVDVWHKFVKQQLRDTNPCPQLDEKIIFSNMETSMADYASKKLPYALEEHEIPAYEEIISTLYSPEERAKLEWAIGAVVSGDSKKVQKFVVMYGPPASGKSTMLNIIQQLFDGYYSVFDSKALGSANNSFALEAFKSNPLVAIQHDGDLSKIEDNTRLNSLVSHEIMTVNEKFKSAYATRFNSFLFMGTNKPVKITDSKSGIIRRLIDISPSGKKIDSQRYSELTEAVKYELGGIAYHCLSVYKANKRSYDNYIPTQMISYTNDFYNYITDPKVFATFSQTGSTTLKIAWDLYEDYNKRANVPYSYKQSHFKEELKSYFTVYKERASITDDPNRPWNFYSGFITDKFINADIPNAIMFDASNDWLHMDCEESIFDKMCKDCPAQYANAEGTPSRKWVNVDKTLGDISTNLLHYVKVPSNHIVIDFDIPDENGNKSYELNAKEANKWPKTYAELSKSGQGIHLHYIYTGDPAELSNIYAEHIEIKVYNGDSSLRRKLSRCNDIPITTISSGLPLRKVKKNKMINDECLANEKAIRTFLTNALKGEYSPGHCHTLKFIKETLDKCYASGMEYDVRIYKGALHKFADRSKRPLEALEIVADIPLCSEHFETAPDDPNAEIAFFDWEVYPDWNGVCYKIRGKEPAYKIKNPTPSDIERILKYRLVGYNNRKYDNHVQHGVLTGDTPYQTFARSKMLIANDPNGYISSSFNDSYLDLLDCCSEKISLKKWEIRLGLPHIEMDIPWDQPVPDEATRDRVMDYCENDVRATEAVYEAIQKDIKARMILADLSGKLVNDTTNTHTKTLIVGNDRTPQDKFNYRNLAEPVYDISPSMREFLEKNFPKMMSEPHGEAKSILPYFPGYIYANGKSVYKGQEVGEGGRVWAKPGMYSNVWTFDVASMHPHSATAEYLFGPYTDNFNNLMEARIAIKHEDFDKAGELYGGKLKRYLTDKAEAKGLSNALKIAINSVYGLTAASFDNQLHDRRNKDNIVAKRGALFMVDLQEAVESMGGEVVHIKTDSIKVVNPSEELKRYILEFGERYGYTFEVEHVFEKFCLVNDAVYIAKCSEEDPETPGKWTATGKQFQVPYVFKTLFSHEPIEFEDLCETYSVKSALYLDFNEDKPDVTKYEKELDKLLKTENWTQEQADILKEEIKKGHSYAFIGKVGQFCPIKPGFGAAELVRYNTSDISGFDHYAFTSGAKGYRWLESSFVKGTPMENNIDASYYISLVDDAVDAIKKAASESGKDYEWFIS